MAYQEELTLTSKSKSKSKIFTVEISPNISKLKEENLRFNLEVKEEYFIFLKSQVSSLKSQVSSLKSQFCYQLPFQYSNRKFVIRYFLSPFEQLHAPSSTD